MESVLSALPTTNSLNTAMTTSNFRVNKANISLIQGITWKVYRRILRKERKWEKEEKERKAHDTRLPQNMSEREKLSSAMSCINAIYTFIVTII